MNREAYIRELDQMDPASLVVTPGCPAPNTTQDVPLPWGAVIQYRGFDIRRSDGPWMVSHQWAKQGWDLGDPIGHEQSIRDCMNAIDEWIEDNQ